MTDSISDDNNVANLELPNKNINMECNSQSESKLNIVTPTVDDNNGKFKMETLSNERPVPPPRLKKFLFSLKSTKNRLPNTATKTESATDATSNSFESKIVANINENLEIKKLPNDANDSQEYLDKINVNKKRDSFDNDEENNDGKIRSMLPINADAQEPYNGQQSRTTMATTSISDYAISGTGGVFSSQTSSTILSTQTSIGSCSSTSMENTIVSASPIIANNGSNGNLNTAIATNHSHYPSGNQFKHYRKHKIMDLRDDKPITGTGITSTIISEFFTLVVHF